jgi:hypothetical protein
MTKEDAKVALTGIWILAIVAIAYGGNTTSTSSWIALVSLTLIPPMAIWRFWNDPQGSMSESMQEARR